MQSKCPYERKIASKPHLHNICSLIIPKSFDWVKNMKQQLIIFQQIKNHGRYWKKKNVAAMQQNSGAHCNWTKDNYKSLSLLVCAKYDEIDIDYSKVLVSK